MYAYDIFSYLWKRCGINTINYDVHEHTTKCLSRNIKHHIILKHFHVVSLLIFLTSR